MEFDVAETLRDRKHEVVQLGVEDDLSPVRKLVNEARPDIVFNLLESFHTSAPSTSTWSRFSSCCASPTPAATRVASRWRVTRHSRRRYSISTESRCPSSSLVRMGRKVRRPKRLTFPLIVKSLTQEASIGISRASVVDDDERLVERVRFIHDNIGTERHRRAVRGGARALVGLIGNTRSRCSPSGSCSSTRCPTMGA